MQARRGHSSSGLIGSVSAAVGSEIGRVVVAVERWTFEAGRPAISHAFGLSARKEAPATWLPNDLDGEVRWGQWTDDAAQGDILFSVQCEIAEVDHSGRVLGVKDEQVPR